MFFLLILLFLFIFANKAEAQSFNYQFELRNNYFNLELFKSLDLPSLHQAIPAEESRNYLIFEYKLQALADLPLDLPLFLIASNKRVLFFATADLADNQYHKIQLKLPSPGELPIFYQNNYLTAFALDIKNLTFAEEQIQNDIKPTQFSNLNVIREADQSLTVLFSVEDDNRMAKTYRLFCADNPQTFVELSKDDDFLWPNFLFTSLLSNQQQELIFHLVNFSCPGLVYLEDAFGNQSARSSIIEVSEL